MADQTEVNFYDVYTGFRPYEPPVLKSKHIQQFDYEFWTAAGCETSSAVLEVGSGTGMFLAYLEHKGVARYFGLDTDEAVLEVLPDSIKQNFAVQDIWDFLDRTAGSDTFDHIVLFDVFEHFSPQDGVRLLKAFRAILNPSGRITLRMPNMESPWAMQYQFGDLTHKGAYNANSLKQVALAANYNLVSAIPQRRSKGIRRMKEAILESILNVMLTEPPKIWSANFIAVLESRPDEATG